MIFFTWESFQKFSVSNAEDLLHAVVVGQENDQELARVGTKQLKLAGTLPPTGEKQ